MDKRGFGAIGAIVCMVVAGLIVYGVVYYGPDIWHGIQGGSGDGGSGGTVNIYDILTHPNQYLGKEIAIEGNLMMIQQGFHSEDWITVYDNEWFVDIVQQGYLTFWAHATILYPALTQYSNTTGVTFRFTGIVCHTDNSSGALLSGYALLSGGNYLELSNVEIVSI